MSFMGPDPTPAEKRLLQAVRAAEEQGEYPASGDFYVDIVVACQNRGWIRRLSENVYYADGARLALTDPGRVLLRRDLLRL